MAAFYSKFSWAFRGVNTDFFYYFSGIFLISPTSDQSDFLLKCAVHTVYVHCLYNKNIYTCGERGKNSSIFYLFLKVVQNKLYTCRTIFQFQNTLEKVWNLKFHCNLQYLHAHCIMVILKVWFRFVVFNATFNNISVLLVEETRENHRPVASHWQTLSHNVLSSTPCHEQGSNSQLLWW